MAARHDPLATARRALRLAALALALACGSDGADAGLLIRVSLAPNVPATAITILRATIEPLGRAPATRDFTPAGGGPVAFPTSFVALVAPGVPGPVHIDVQGLDAARVTRAHGAQDGVALAAGKTLPVDITLDCVGAACPAADGGSDGASDAPTDATGEGAADCGNGKIDPGETCDTGIAAGKPGACPPASCDDGLACTKDIASGDGCGLDCTHTEVKALLAGDGCCPANGTHETDADCSATCGNGTIEAGETCDKAIAAGGHGACPLAPDCVDGEPCTRDLLLSANTCSARCIHTAIGTLVSGDMCCPPGGDHNSDSDCPVVCGNGIVESGETCDNAIMPPAAGACPTGCDDGLACTADTLTGSGCAVLCKTTAIIAFVPGDGCCPPGGNHNVDGDCPTVCGNGVVEAPETCDKFIAAGTPGACPASCPADGNACTVESLDGMAADCSARCRSTPVSACAATPDACCPSGCTFASDPDCSATCGNGSKEPGELCDTAIAPGMTDACPTSCADTNPCTGDALQSAGTCSAQCTFTPIIDFIAGDGCCPPGGNHSVDTDCAAVCGNGIVEGPAETCDKALLAGAPGACPTDCPPSAGCSTFTLTGSKAACTAACTPGAITACAAADGCCPSGCNKVNDGDCAAVCGNGVVEPPAEACDKGITTGNTGACAASCDDGMACTVDTTSGNVEDCTRDCSNTAVTACAGGDMCCPSGCNATSDSDCAALCGNSVIETGETCDPPSSCPTTCLPDGDACSQDLLGGDPAMCTAVCTHPAITLCSGGISDLCCPTGCDATTDADCVPSCGNHVTEAGEECDDGNGDDSDDCTAACKASKCGDGNRHLLGTPPFEECDDGNADSSDDCTTACKTWTCGDGYKHLAGTAPFEECDDGNPSNADDCTTTCKTSRCGDGYKHLAGTGPFEECDDGNPSNADDCTTACKAANCGDGFQHTAGTGPFESCDDGNSSNADNCVAGCKVFSCGDGHRHTTGAAPLEECDDGNGIGGDACDAACRNVDFLVASSGSKHTTPVPVVSATGAFLVAWVDGSSAGAPVYRMRPFTNVGVARSLEVTLGTASPATSTIDAAPAPSDDAFIVAFGVPNGLMPGFQLRARIVDEKGVFLDGSGMTVQTVGTPTAALAAVRATHVPGGSFFVAWRLQIPAAAINRLDGRPVSLVGSGSAFTLVDVPNSPFEPDVGPYGSGQVSAVWADGSPLDVRTRSFVAGSGVGGATEVVNINTAKDQREAALAADTAGNRFVLWSDQSSVADLECGTTSCGVEGRYSRYCPSPCLPLPESEFAVNSASKREQRAGDVAFNRGRFVTVIHTAAAGGSGSDDCVPGATCDAAVRLWNGGSPVVNPFTGLSTEMLVNQDASRATQKARVAVGSDGSVLVVWEEWKDASSVTIRGRYFPKLVP